VTRYRFGGRRGPYGYEALEKASDKQRSSLGRDPEKGRQKATGTGRENVLTRGN